MDLSVKTAGGNAQTLEVADAVFAVEYKQGLVHQVVTAHMASARAGTKAQKNRTAVRGDLAQWRGEFCGDTEKLRAKGKPQDVPRCHTLHSFRTDTSRKIYRSE